MWQAESGKGLKLGYPACFQKTDWAGCDHGEAAVMVGETAVAVEEKLGEDGMV